MPDDRKAQREMWDALNRDNALPRRELVSLRKRFRAEMERMRKDGLKPDPNRDKLRAS
jgi:hypothetical protein